MNDFDQDKKELGEKGEDLAWTILKRFGFILARADFIGYKKEQSQLYGEKLKSGEEVEFEIKAKAEPFKQPPFDGHGADIYQIKKRMERYRKHGIKQFLLIIQKDGKVYGQWLHELEIGEKYDTKNKIRIYPLNNFIEIPEFIWKGL